MRATSGWPMPNASSDALKSMNFIHSLQFYRPAIGRPGSVLMRDLPPHRSLAQRPRQPISLLLGKLSRPLPGFTVREVVAIWRTKAQAQRAPVALVTLQLAGQFAGQVAGLRHSNHHTGNLAKPLLMRCLSATRSGWRHVALCSNRTEPLTERRVAHVRRTPRR